MIINHYEKGFGKIKSKLENKYPTFMEKYIVPKNTLLMDRIFLKQSRKKSMEYLSQDKFPIFRTIEIETINRCNGTCSFCPVNRNVDTRPLQLMDKKLFVSIIDQLKEINYSGSIGLYSNNEPLLDKRIYHFLSIAKENLPNASLYIFTNGTLLTINKLDELMKYLDTLVIDNYNDNLVLNDNVKKIYKYALTKPYKNKISIYIRKENEVLTNRGGEAKNRTKNKATLKSACMYPFEQFVVRPDGKVSLCCNDAMGKMTLGDLNREKVLDVWNGNKFNTIRQNMVKDRSLNYLCKECDTVTPKVFGDETINIKDYVKMLFFNHK